MKTNVTLKFDADFCARRVSWRPKKGVRLVPF